MSARYAGLFLRAYLISCLQSAGVLLLARESLLAVLTAYWINSTWYGNSQRANDHRGTWAKRWYATGGACGTATSLLVARWLR